MKLARSGTRQPDYLDSFPHAEKQRKAFYRAVAKCEKASTFEENQVNENKESCSRKIKKVVYPVVQQSIFTQT